MATGVTLWLLGSFTTVCHGTSPTEVELEWHDLVPAGWEPPLILPDHEGHVDKASLVSDLPSQSVKLAGYMKPIVFEENRVSVFLLVPFLAHHVKQHAHYEANQTVYVSLAEPLAVDNPFQPLWVMGKIVPEPVETDDGPAGYSIIDAVTEAYEY